MKHLSCSENKYETLLRNEIFGPILWSRYFDSYFMPDEIGIKAIRGEVNEFVEPARRELEQIGFSSGTRVLNNFSDRKIMAPLEVYFDYTWSCNLHCPHCYNKKRNRATSLNEEQITHVIREMQKNGVMRLHLAGGEPMSDFDKLSTYVHEVKKQNMRMSLNSNGTLVTDSALDLILNNDIVTATFSLDGPDVLRNDKTRGSGSFYLASKGIKKAVNLKEHLNSTTKIQLKMFWETTTPLIDFKDMVEYGLELGVDMVQFHCPKKDLDNDGNIVDYYKRVSTIKELEERNLGRISVQNVWNPLINSDNLGVLGLTGCIGAQELLGIHPNGNITPCMMNPYNLGNLFLDYSGDFAKFWNTSRELDEYHHRLSNVNDECASCETYVSCRGGSKSRCNIDDLKSKDLLCPKNIKKEQVTQEKFSQRFNHFKRIYVAHGI